MSLRNSESILAVINHRRAQLSSSTDEALRLAAQASSSLAEQFAAVATVCERVLGLRPFDVQILGALAMAEGKIAEMQTGEGKTLAATMAIYALVRSGSRCHVLTANDYLARRDAEWMGGIYRFLGLSAGYIAEGMTAAERRRAYACDITYATANEVGFDYLRDSLVFRTEDLLQPPFEAALIDEADSILLDEARIPLVIAGGEAPPQELARRMAQVVRGLTPWRDYTTDTHGRNVSLTDAGLKRAETAAGYSNLYDLENLAALEALQNALHAAALLRRDVDYVVKHGRVELVDEFKGRIAENRRWPAGLQTALEAKENLELQKQGRVLGTLTLQNLVSLYPKLCGMTGTAATQAAEFKEMYGLEVVAIPTNRPMIRVDHSDVVFPTQADKERAVVREIVETHRTGRPILVGTASVSESERLSARLTLAGVPHTVLNARDNERESQIVAQAGALGAVTVSTNMAGRGTDIPLGGEPVRALGGLYVIGTNRHESRRIDHQLRGRAGRQGDPGSSRFFLSLDDDLMQRYGVSEFLPMGTIASAIESVQRLIESENLDIRSMLWKYEKLQEQQRRVLSERRTQRLKEQASETELDHIDNLWADYLAQIAELGDGLCWIALGGRDPFPDYLRAARDLFDELMQSVDDWNADGEVEDKPVTRGATWTYLVKDMPFGTMTERLFAGIQRRIKDALRKAS